MMGAHVLEQSRLHDVEKLVIVGTVCAYPKFTPVPFDEDNLWDGYPEETNAPYGVAKKTILVGAQAYREQYGLHSIFLLPTNLYGPRDNFHPTNAHVIPDLIRKMLESPDEVVLWGDGSPTREFLYVDDCAEGLVLAADRYDGAGPGQPRRGQGDLDPRPRGADRRRDRLRRTIEWDTTKPNGQPRRSVDGTRARGAVRLRGADAASRGARAYGRLVPGARACVCAFLARAAFADARRRARSGSPGSSSFALVAPAVACSFCASRAA